MFRVGIKRNVIWAWRGSSSYASAPWLGVVGGIVGFAISKAAGLSIPQYLLADPLLAAAVELAACSVVGVAVVFLVRLAWAPIRFVLQPARGLRGAIQASLGANMLPVLLMSGAVVLFVVLFGTGAIWFVATASKTDPGAARSADLMNAVGRAYWLRGEAETIRNLSNDYDKASSLWLAAYLGPDPRSRLYGKGGFNPRGMMDEAVRKLVEAIRADTGQTIDLTRHPEFDQNHNLPTPRADEIEDASLREDYRRLYDQFSTSNRTLSIVNQRYDAALAAAEMTVARLSRPQRFVTLPADMAIPDKGTQEARP